MRLRKSETNYYGFFGLYSRFEGYYYDHLSKFYATNNREIGIEIYDDKKIFWI